MFVRKIVGGISDLATSSVRTGVHTADWVIGHGKQTATGAASAGTTVAGTVVRSAVGRLRPPGRASGAPETATDPAEAAVPDSAADNALPDAVAEEAPDDGPDEPSASPAKKAAPPAKKSAAPPTQKPTAKKGAPRKAEPRPVTAADLPLPNLPEEPPVDIVEQVIAAEENGEPTRQGFATEPKGASRDETHGDAALQRAEVEELAEETVEATAEGSVDIETPVGTTGADVAFNPDTAEADLQQPQTEPLLDPSLTKEVIAEAEIGAGDADVRKD